MLIVAAMCSTLLPSLPSERSTSPAQFSRRALLSSGLLTISAAPVTAAPMLEQTLKILPSESGLKWADIKQGAGRVPKPGDKIVIDYQMTRRGGAKIYSTKQSQQPFAWTLGDGTVIEGLEIGVLGSADVTPMQSGGIRRLIVPQFLGYGKGKGLTVFQEKGQGQGGFAPTEILQLQPVPPDFVWTDGNGDKVNAYVRFKDLYMEEFRLDQPDLIIDCLLYTSPSPRDS